MTVVFDIPRVAEAARASEDQGCIAYLGYG